MNDIYEKLGACLTANKPVDGMWWAGFDAWIALLKAKHANQYIVSASTEPFMLFGMPIVRDASVPADTIELREAGRIIGKIVNIG